MPVSFLFRAAWNVNFSLINQVSIYLSKWCKHFSITSTFGFFKGFLAPGEIDPLNRRFSTSFKPDVVVQGWWSISRIRFYETDFLSDCRILMQLYGVVFSLSSSRVTGDQAVAEWTGHSGPDGCRGFTHQGDVCSHTEPNLRQTG